jgi:hypothetical protein
MHPVEAFAPRQLSLTYVFPLKQVPGEFQIWELNGDWMYGIGMEDLAKPATGRQWIQKTASTTASTSLTLQKTGLSADQNQHW